MDAVVGNGERRIQHERLVVPVHGHAVCICALRQGADAPERRLARCFEDGFSEPVEIGDLELVHHLDQPPAPFVVARRTRVDVALDLQRLAHVGTHEAQQILVHAPLASERHDRNGQPFLEHLAAVRPHPEAADVYDVNRVGEQPDRLAAVKGRRDDGDVVEMPRGEPRVVGDVMVAWLHPGQRIDVEEVLHRIGHRVHVSGGAGDGLRQHAAIAVEHAGGKIAGLAHRSAERRANHGLRLLFHNGDQTAPHDLAVNLSKRSVGACDHGFKPRDE